MDICVLFTILIFLVIVKNTSSRYELESLKNSKSYLKQGRDLDRPSTNNLTGWLIFQHSGNSMFINTPELSGAHRYDTGVFNKKCICTRDQCKTNIWTCAKAGCPDSKCDPGPHMICDLKGNRIEWNDLKSGMVVKIRTLHRNWPGYEYLYASVGGWIYYDILRNRKDHEGSANYKQEWIVEKTDSMIRFQSNYRAGEYLTGDLVYEDERKTCRSCDSDDGGWCCRWIYWYWLYVGSENPTWWKVTSANS